MGEISINADVRFIRDALQNEAGDYVKHIWDKRKLACVEAVGEVLNAGGYLPNGTTWYAVGNECWFSVDKGKADLAHYFNEGYMYGPNYPIFASYEMTTGKNGKPKYVRDAQGHKIGIGEPIAYRSPKHKTMKDEQIGSQTPKSPSGVAHWEKEVQPGGAMFNEYIQRCEEILRR